MFVVSQIIGIVAVVFFLLSFQLKHRRHILWVTCLSNGLYVLQYVLLGAFSGAVLDLLSTCYSFLAGKKHDPRFGRYVRFASAAIILLIVAAGVTLAVVQRRWMELIPVFGTLLQTGGLWFSKEQTIRKFALAGAPFWLTYNFLSQAYGAAAGSLLSMISVTVALIRYRTSAEKR